MNATEQARTATPPAAHTCPACHGHCLVVSYGRNVLCGLCDGNGTITTAALDDFHRAAETTFPDTDYDERGNLILVRFEDDIDYQALFESLAHEHDARLDRR